MQAFGISQLLQEALSLTCYRAFRLCAQKRSRAIGSRAFANPSCICCCQFANRSCIMVWYSKKNKKDHCDDRCPISTVPRMPLTICMKSLFQLAGCVWHCKTSENSHETCWAQYWEQTTDSPRKRWSTWYCSHAQRHLLWRLLSWALAKILDDFSCTGTDGDGSHVCWLLWGETGILGFGAVSTPPSDS